MLRRPFPRIPAVCSVSRIVLFDPSRTDGAIYCFEVVLGSTRFSYGWHTIAPAGWEPVVEWLARALHQLRQLAGVTL
jgi:hypothetical protein